MMRAVSGIDMALWDLAGKVLGTTTTTLLGGKFRDRVRVYDHSGPGNSLDKAACKQWAEQRKPIVGFGMPGIERCQLGEASRSDRGVLALRSGPEQIVRLLSFSSTR